MGLLRVAVCLGCILVVTASSLHKERKAAELLARYLNDLTEHEEEARGLPAGRALPKVAKAHGANAAGAKGKGAKEMPVTGTTTMHPMEVPEGSVWHCDFEEKPEDPSKTLGCGTVQLKDDDFDWTRHDGPTPSHITGPMYARSGKYYIYIEASKPRKLNDTAAFTIPEVDKEGDYCLSFQLSMFGFHIRTIEVFVENKDDERTTVWSESKEYKGPCLTEWRMKVLDMELQEGDKIGFRAYRGNGYSGDIGLDFIDLSHAPC